MYSVPAGSTGDSPQSQYGYWQEGSVVAQSTTSSVQFGVAIVQFEMLNAVVGVLASQLLCAQASTYSHASPVPSTSIKPKTSTASPLKNNSIASSPF